MSAHQLSTPVEQPVRRAVARQVRRATARLDATLGREHGFTLIEELVAIVILGLLFAAFSTMISSAINDSAQVTNDSVLQTQVRFALDELTGELRQAFPVSGTAGSEFKTSTGTLSPTTLTFYTPDTSFSAGSAENETAFHLNEVSYQLSGPTGNANLQRAFATSTTTCSSTATATCGGTWSIPALGSAVTRVGQIVNSNIFTYYTNSVPPVTTTNPAQASTVVITLTVQPSSGQQFTFTDSATLRTPA